MPTKGTIPRICRYCGAPFLTRPYKVLADQVKYCSTLCQNRARTIPPEERFWPRVDCTSLTGCWPWIGYRDRDGYGSMSVGNRHDGNRRTLGTHVFALEQRLGRPLAPGMQALHTCDLPACTRNDGDVGVYEVNGVARIRYGHLWEGTTADNGADMAQKGRGLCGDLNPSRRYPERVPRGDRHRARLHPETSPHGERSGTAKLTDSGVREIRRRAAAGGYGIKAQLARDNGVDWTTINKIVLRQTWKHVL